MKLILGKMRKAIQDYRMIEPDELICVGVSGGKDSMLLLDAMARFQKFSPIPFRLHALCLDLGFKNIDFSSIKHFCEAINMPCTIKQTRIAEIVFEVREEKNPCALCSNLKRGALHNAALELGSTKLALGHHADDLIETFLLSLLYEGRIKTFQAVTYLDRKKITVIRPFVYLKESEIIYHANKEHIPVLKSGCPADGNTKRQEMKDLVKQLAHDIPGSEDRLFSAVKKYLESEDHSS